MRQRRHAGEEEQKSITELVERRKKEIKQAMDSGDPLDEALWAITGEDVLGRPGGGGGSAGGPGGFGKGPSGSGSAGGKSKQAHQGYAAFTRSTVLVIFADGRIYCWVLCRRHRPSAGKHPRHQQSGGSSFAPSFGGSMFGRR
jgi:hypothetical protein